MGPLGYPLQGRFSRQDVTRSRVAQQAVFGGPYPADMVYITGTLDHPYTVNPIRIRAYDRAGNLLAAIRIGDIADHDYTGVADSEAWLRDPAHGYVITATDRNGGAIDLFGYAIADVDIQDAVVTPDGMIYCAMAPGNKAAWQPKAGYNINYVVSELAPLSGTAYNTRLHELAEQVTIYFYGHFRKFRRSGDRIPFPELHDGLILSLALDSAGNIYTGGVPVGGPQNMLRKYDPDGNLLWSAGTSEVGTTTFLSGVYQVIVSADDSAVYVVGREISKSFFKKYNSAGVLQWTRRLYYSEWKCLVMDDDGYIYTGGYSTGYTIDDEYTVNYFNAEHGYTVIQKWDSAGALVDSALFQTTRQWPGGAVVIEDANLFLLLFVNNEIHCKSEWGLSKNPYFVCGKDLQLHTPVLSRWVYVRPAGLAYEGYYDTLAVDNAGRQYLPRMTENNQIIIGGVAHGTPIDHLSAYDFAGDKIWRDRNAIGDTTFPYTDPLSEYIIADTSGSGHPGWTVGLGTAFTPYATSGDALVTYRQTVLTGRSIALLNASDTPALALPFRIAAPTWIGDLYSAIPALALPLALAVPVWFRDYVGRLRATIYRLFLTGSPDIELLISSFQVRRNTDRRWLSVVIPAADGATIAAIDARSAGHLVLMRGVRMDDGAEQIDEMLRVPLTGIRLDIGSARASATLDGASAETVSPKSRTLYGISYQAVDDGRRRVRCQVDTYLAPGDTADLGDGNSLTVGELVYTVNPISATMEVTEARP